MNAIDAPGAVGRLRQYRRHALSVLLVGIGLFIAFCTLAVILSDRADRLERDGIRVDGVIVETKGRGALDSGSVTVEFDYGGVNRNEVVHLDDDSPEYSVGQPTVVIVDPNDPEKMTIEGESNDPPVYVVPMIITLVLGVMAIAIGIALLVRVRRFRTVMSSSDWRQLPIECRQVGYWNSTIHLLRIRDERGDHPLTLSSLNRIRLKRGGLDDATEADVAGEPTRRVVVRAIGSDLWSLAYAPRSARATRRWHERFGQLPDLG